MDFNSKSKDGRAVYSLPVVGETKPPICIRRHESARMSVEDRSGRYECLPSLEISIEQILSGIARVRNVVVERIRFDRRGWRLIGFIYFGGAWRLIMRPEIENGR